MPIVEVFYLYVCPTFGSILSTMMFAAPVNDLRRALREGDFGVLDPFPFVMMAGNCLGWIIYGHLLMDPFLVAANMAGFLCSVWLNMGSAKIQYHQLQKLQNERNLATLVADEEQWDASPPMDTEEDQFLGPPYSDINQELFAFGPQETLFFRMMSAWAALATYCTWFTDRESGANIVAWAVNINLVFFYGAPLNTIFSVVTSGDSSAIHRRTLQMSFINTSFWILYGLAVRNPFVVVPNATGLCLGIIQGILCVFYPSKSSDLTTEDSAADPVSLSNTNMATTPSRSFSIRRFILSSFLFTTPVTSLLSSSTEEKCVVMNPLTNRPIQVYGPTYRKMLQSGYIFHAGELYPIFPDTYAEPIPYDKWTLVKPDPTEIEGLLIVDKPSGLLSVPGREHSDSILTRVQREIHPDTKVCHRLDRDTSGILALAFNATVHRQISQQFEKRQTTKLYEALVYGHVQSDSGTVELPIGKRQTEEGYNRWVVGGDDARPAKTSWKVQERCTSKSNNFAFTRLEIQPKTGRGHQIRLHLAHMGHPILGDTLHAPPTVAKASPRLCLHAAYLNFTVDDIMYTARSAAPF
jgi:23S rRNA-/tRNA-specific pseudouridylate synthase/uncharacterized protein with PQ loop repeat